MTHQYIPTLTVVRYAPKHRRDVTYAGPMAPDRMNDARCHDSGKRHCRSMCPRHDATAYSMHMAAHATDSI